MHSCMPVLPTRIIILVVPGRRLGNMFAEARPFRRLPACARGPCFFSPLVGMDGCVVCGRGGASRDGRRRMAGPSDAIEVRSSIVSVAIHPPPCWHLWYYSPKYGVMSSKPRGALLLPGVGLLIHQQQPRSYPSATLSAVPPPREC